ncbi:conserved hypothetical protein [Ixodes scapularis]|uniref:PBZ-type domain-containing protein n=1 Tax=Ixodes scapularis TaxID=6945 RepID=B7P1A4_IXOSC|nr:conserved hypothetical protein [Ixodes scapularis]|eukprot:XP_002400732.1 conserved hypothetical protein [Ixodes scapularis]
MKKVVLKPVEGPQKPVELKIGKTIIGRGPLLETHVNPCFYQAQNKGPSRVMKKDKQHVLASGDSIALLPTSYKYIVEVISPSTTSPSSQVADEVTKPAGESEEKDSLAEKPATAAIPAEEAKKNGSAEAHHNSSNNKESVIKAENGERGSSKEASPEVCRKPATQPPQKKGAPSDESKAKPQPEGKRTLPRWLVESASKSAASKPKPAAQPRGKAASNRDEPASKTRRTSVPEKEPVKQRGKPPAKESESGGESKEEAKSGKSEESGEEKSESEEEYKPKAKEEKGVTGSRESKGSRGGRSSRQNRSTMQKISLDDFVASDDDDDWEEENCKTKRVARRFVPSDSDSASDWERSSSRKKKQPATRTRVQRKRRRRASSERESSEGESDDAPLKRPTRRTPAKRESCKYGKKCFRKNALHLKNFKHPTPTKKAPASQTPASKKGKRGGKAKGGSSNDEKASGDEYDWKDEDSENGGDGNGTKEAAKTFSRRKPRTSERPSAAAD